LKLAAPTSKSILLGIACGVGASVFWAAGLAAARHGIAAGLSPFDIAFHRYVWSGLIFLPIVLHHGIGDLNGIGWGRGIVLAILGGPGQAAVSASGFLLVPLAHAGVIQPSCAVLVGLLLAALVLKERLPPYRIGGAVAIVLGVAVIGGEALTTIGTHGVLGDVTFAVAGLMFAVFGMLLRLWRINPMRATAALSVLTLFYVPVHAVVFGFGRMAAAGVWENVLQVVVQGIFSGPGAIYLFARSIVLLGASRAVVFPSLVPGLTLIIGFLALGEVPSVMQLVGLAIVLIGFRLTQKA
jgi:drug/metabolite transporter (DMT)-like permease